MYFFPLHCCWQVILKWQSEDSEGGRRALGGVFVMCGPHASGKTSIDMMAQPTSNSYEYLQRLAMSPQKVSHRLNLLFHLLLQKLSFQRPKKCPVTFCSRSPGALQIERSGVGVGALQRSSSEARRKRCRFRWTKLDHSICH